MLLSLPLDLTLISNAVNSSTDEANVGISLLQYAQALCDMKVETFSVESFEKDDHFGLISSDASFSWNRSVEEDLREECSRILCAVSQKYFTARDCTDSPFQDSNNCQPYTHSETDSYVNSSSGTSSASSIGSQSSFHPSDPDVEPDGTQEFKDTDDEYSDNNDDDNDDENDSVEEIYSD